MRKLKVYFNEDNQLYGVQEWRTDFGYNGESGRWVQILPPEGKGARSGKSAYTHYRKVAERWLRELKG